MIRFFLFFVFVFQSAIASPLSDGALKLIQVGSEIGSRDVVMRGQSLLIKGAFDLNDLDALYESSKQVRFGNQLMGYPAQPQLANQLLIQLVRKSYDPALYDYALYLLDGEGGFIKNEFLALNLLEESFMAHGNAKSAFLAAVIRNESLVPGTKDKQRIGELITFAVLNQVKGAKNYQLQHIDSGHWRSLKIENWRTWLDSE